MFFSVRQPVLHHLKVRFGLPGSTDWPFFCLSLSGHKLSYQLVYHSRVCLALHGPHGLAHDEAHGFLFSCLEVCNGLRVLLQQIFNGLCQRVCIIDTLSAVFLNVTLRIHVFLIDGFKYVLRHGTVDDVLLHQADELCQILRGKLHVFRLLFLLF